MQGGCFFAAEGTPGKMIGNVGEAENGNLQFGEWTSHDKAPLD
jgi:hypothetical protein